MINKIYCCDCLELLSKLPNDSIDLIITDPPYELTQGGGGKKGLSQRPLYNNPEYLKIINGFDYDKVLPELQRVLKKMNMFMFCSNKQISKLMSWGEQQGYFTNLLVWHKTNPTPFVGGTYLSDLEFIVHFRESGATFQGGTDIKSKLYQSPLNRDKYDHPTIKPLPLIKKLIRLGSNKGDLVFDPFLGSGTTAVACRELDRNYLGCDIEQKYIDIANKRLTNVTKELF